MTRRFIAFFILLFFLSIPIQSISASNDKSYTTTRLNKGGSVAIILGNKFGFDIAGLIIPFFTKAEEIATPDFIPSADFKQTVEMYQVPQNLWDLGKLIRWDQGANPIYHFAKYGAILFTDADHSDHPPASDCIISEDIEKSSEVVDAPVAFEGSQVLNAMIGLRGIDANESGIIDFNKAPTGLEGMDAGEDCKRHDPGIDLLKIENGLRALSRFGGPGTLIEGTEMTTLMRIISYLNRSTGEVEEREVPDVEPTKNRVILTRKQKNDHYNILCNDYWCPSEEIGKGSETADKVGGWTNFLFPAHQQKKVPHASVQGFDVTIAGGFPAGYLPNSNDGFNQSQVGLQMASCYVTPDTSNTTGGDIQLTAYYGKEDDNVKINPVCKPIIAQCPIDLIKEKYTGPSDSSCKLCNQQSAAQFMESDEKSAFGSGLSPLAVKVIEAAADTYKVPAGVLLATMLHEGSFFANRWTWSSDDVIVQYSDCTMPGPMPNCANQNGSEGPFGFIVDPWWNNYMEGGKNPYDGKNNKFELEGIDEVLKNIPPENFSPCNFTDAAFMAAREISEDQSHAYEEVPGSCTSTFYGTINFYQGTDLPQSCGSWDSTRVATTRLQYAEGIAEGACKNDSPESIAITNDIGRMVKMYEAMKCGN